MNRKLTTILITLSLALGLTSWRAFSSNAASEQVGAKAKPLLSKYSNAPSLQGVNPNSFAIQSISYAGSGCPQGSVGQSMSNDRKAATLIFDSFVASSGPGVPVIEGRKNCQITLNVSVPVGVLFKVVSDHRGYVSLPSGVAAEAKATYYANGKTQTPDAATFSGPISKDYLRRDQAIVVGQVCANCPPDAPVTPVNANTQIQLVGPAMSSQITTDSIDIRLEPAATEVIAWGDNRSGQTDVPANLSDVTALAGGDFHNLALKSDGTVVAWGRNNFGQASVPTGLTGVTAIAAKGAVNLALKSDGTVVAWPGSSGAANVPSGLTDVTAIAVGFAHGLALKSDGTVVAWGSNFGGQLNVPSGLTGVTAIAAGTYHNVALKSDGTVVAWGGTNDDYGQTDVPAGLTGVTAIAAGEVHSLALKSDGTVVVWGPSAVTNVPSGLTGVTAIGVGSVHSLALKGDGTVVAWGGFNTFGESNVPAGLTGVIAITGGRQHSLALRITNAPSNTPPTISGATLTRTAGSPLANATIATVNDTESGAAGVTVTVNGGGSATSNNVTVSNLVNTNGTITADIVAACGATNATFTLTATDGGTLTETSTLTVNVNPEATAPTLNPMANVTVTLPLNSTATSTVVTFPLPTATDNCTANPTVTTVPASGAVFPVGTTTVNVTATDGAGNQTTGSFTVTVLYNFGGIQSPLAAAPTVNVANGGQSLPVKFSLSGFKGLNIFAVGSPTSQQIACASGGPVSTIEETASAGGNGLNYDAATDQYIYIWKTEKAWKGTCRKLTLTFNDGMTREVFFQFK